MSVALKIGIGLAALGRPAYINARHDQDLGEMSVDDLRALTATVLDAAYAAGIRYIDTARSYGRAEEFLASWLRSRPEVDDVIIGSKWGYRYVGDWRLDADVHEVKGSLSLAAFTEQLAHTRALLGDGLRIYHIHSATLDTGVLSDVALHRALACLRDQGVRIGISTSGPAQADAVRRALDVTVDGGANSAPRSRPPGTCSRPPLPRPSLRPGAAGAQVIVKEALANGSLAPGGESHSAVVRPVATLAADLGIGMDQLAMAAALAQPWAFRVLSGAVSPEQVLSNAGAAALTLPTGVLQELSTLTQPSSAYWAARSRRDWG